MIRDYYITAYCIFCICAIRGQCMVLCMIVFITIVYCVWYRVLYCVLCIYCWQKKIGSQWKHFLFWLTAQWTVRKAFGEKSPAIKLCTVRLTVIRAWSETKVVIWEASLSLFNVSIITHRRRLRAGRQSGTESGIEQCRSRFRRACACAVNQYKTGNGTLRVL